METPGAPEWCPADGVCDYCMVPVGTIPDGEDSLGETSCDECLERMKQSYIRHYWLQNLVEDITSGVGWSQDRRDKLVPGEQRGKLTQNCWIDVKFIYGMEYGLLAALNLLQGSG